MYTQKYTLPLLHSIFQTHRSHASVLQRFTSTLKSSSICHQCDQRSWGSRCACHAAGTGWRGTCSWRNRTAASRRRWGRTAGCATGGCNGWGCAAAGCGRAFGLNFVQEPVIGTLIRVAAEGTSSVASDEEVPGRVDCQRASTWTQIFTSTSPELLCPFYAACTVHLHHSNVVVAQMGGPDGSISSQCYVEIIIGIYGQTIRLVIIRASHLDQPLLHAVLVVLHQKTIRPAKWSGPWQLVTRIPWNIHIPGGVDHHVQGLVIGPSRWGTNQDRPIFRSSATYLQGWQVPVKTVKM